MAISGTDNIYNDFIIMADHLVGIKILDPNEISPMGPGTINEWAFIKILNKVADTFVEYEKPRDKIKYGMMWMSADLKFHTDIYEANLVPLDEFKVLILAPINPYAKEIFEVYNPNGIHTSNLLEMLYTASNYNEVINRLVNQLKLPLDDAIEYVRLTLFHPHQMVTPSSESLGYSLENGITLSMLFLYRLIDFKTFLQHD